MTHEITQGTVAAPLVETECCRPNLPDIVPDNTYIAGLRFSFYADPIISRAGQVPAAEYTIRDAYNYITGDKAKERTLKCRNINDPQLRANFKKTNFDSVTFGGIFSKRSAAGLVCRSGYVCLDFDHVSDANSLKNNIIADPNLPAVLVFRSPSGDGIKSVLKIDAHKAHKVAFQELTDYFARVYGILPDQSGSDICRGCFLPYDPDAYINETIDYDFQPLPDNKERENVTSQLSLDELVGRIERSGIDITSSYNEWLNVGFSLSTEWGELGRSYFHRLSRRHPEYDPVKCDHQYDACLKSTGSGITISTLYYMAKEHGINISLSEKHTAHTANAAHLEKTTEEKIADFISENEEIAALPSFFEKVKCWLPSIFRTVGELMNNVKYADVVVLAILAVFSRLFDEVSGYYSGKQYHSNLFVAIEGRASCGKGNITYARLFGKYLHMDYLHEYDRAKQLYDDNYQNWAKSDKDGPAPVPPTRKLVYLPADTTSAAMIHTISANEGHGLIFETEMDTLSASTQSQFGRGLSAMLRKAFHHETIENLRSTNDQYINIEYPRISMCISGTPQQINTLIGSGENGLASRFIFYTLPLSAKWDDPFNRDDMPLFDTIDDLAALFHEKFVRQIQGHNVTFQLAAQQDAKFNDYFAKKKAELMAAGQFDIVATLHRLGLITFRIALILATTRALENGDFSESIECDGDSFSAAMAISDVILAHDIWAIGRLPKTPHTFANERKAKFYAALPAEFDRAGYLRIAEEIGQNGRTVDRYIKQFVAEGDLAHIDTNSYAKL